MFFIKCDNVENELRTIQEEVLTDMLVGQFKKAISISGSAHLAPKSLSINTIVERQYPEYDCLSLPDEDESADLFLSDQVLEHVGLRFEKALEEAYRVLKNDGVLVLSTCLLKPLHMEPNDYFRFTSYALEDLAKNAGFKNIRTYSVGSRFDLIIQNLGGAGKRYGWLLKTLKKILQIKNSKKYSILVGIIASK